MISSHCEGLPCDLGESLPSSAVVGAPSCSAKSAMVVRSEVDLPRCITGG